MDIALTVVERIGKSFNTNFRFNDDNIETYKELIRYFHGDPDFAGDLTKGILLMGPTGTGKTLAFEIMAKYREIDNTHFLKDGKAYMMNYSVVDVSQILNYFMNSAYEGIDIYCRRYVVCFDDLGSEMTKAKYYGNELDVISYILSERYAKRLLTFATTNYSMRLLEDKYEDRIFSRMHALFNFMTLNCQDFRRYKTN